MATQVGSLLWISEFTLTILRIRPKLQLQREHQRENRWDYRVHLPQPKAGKHHQLPYQISTHRNHISAGNTYRRHPHL